jgi:hypothetical protein
MIYFFAEEFTYILRELFWSGLVHVVGFYDIVFSFYYFQKTIFKKDDY